MLWLLWRLDKVSSSSNLQLVVPAAGNCGEETILTCKTHNNVPFVCDNDACGWYKDNVKIVRKGLPLFKEGKYKEDIGFNNFNLRIKNTELSDKGSYRCSVGHDTSNFANLFIECKASAEYVHVTVTATNTLMISLERLYPVTPRIEIRLLTTKGSSMPLNEDSYYCQPSKNYKPYHDCTWTSDTSIGNDSDSCYITVTTITQAIPIIKRFKAVATEKGVAASVYIVSTIGIVVVIGIIILLVAVCKKKVLFAMDGHRYNDINIQTLSSEDDYMKQAVPNNYEYVESNVHSYEDLATNNYGKLRFSTIQEHGTKNH